MYARCKFTVANVEDNPHKSAEREVKVTLNTIYSPDVPEDVQFSIYTPNGDMKFYVNNPNVIDMFEIGKEFYVDLTPVEVA